jgi:hypothetical protein
VATGSQLAIAKSKKCRKPAKKRGKNYLFNLISQVEEQQRRPSYFAVLFAKRFHPPSSVYSISADATICGR